MPGSTLLTRSQASIAISFDGPITTGRSTEIHGFPSPLLSSMKDGRVSRGRAISTEGKVRVVVPVPRRCGG